MASNFFNKASLVMVPDAPIDGKLPSVKPEDRSGDFTFSRGSNLAATRVNKDSLIEKGRENILLQSNQFNTTWSAVNASITSGQTGYDGTNDAWLLQSTSSGVSTSVRQFVSISGVGTFSVYAKAGNVNFLALYVASSSGAFNLWADLSSGTIGTTASDIDTTITSAGGGWYRVSLTGLNPNQRVDIYAANTDGSYITATGENIVIQDAQLEQGLVATSLITTGASTAQAGILEDMPRLDYSGGATCPSLLLEPSRTNLIPYSEYASGNLSGNAPTLVENYAISPEGLQNAFQISTDAGTFRRIRKFQTGLSGNTSYSMSVFVKKATSAVSTYGGLGMVWQGGSPKVDYIIFDEYNGTMSILQDQTSNIATKVDDVGDYWRFCAHATDTNTNTYFEGSYYACLSSTGSTIGVGVKSWVGYGLQLEAGSHPTSYIPTYGTSQTRSDDFMTNTNNIFASADDMCWFIDYTLLNEQSSTFRNQIGYRDNSNADFYMIQFASSNQHEFRYRGVAGVNVDMTPAIDAATYGLHRKIIYLKRGTTLKVFCNGVELATTTNANATTFSPANEAFEIGSNYFPDLNVHQLLVFPTALTDDECIALTTI
jgi:hypothetical protein